MTWLDPQLAGFVPAAAGRTWYRLNGLDRTRPAIAGIAGGPGMSHHYLMPLTKLADRHPVLLYDQLDTGNSDRPNDEANWTIDYYVDEIERIREALGLAALVPVGHSWGGLLAYEYALKYPERVAALVLVGPCLSAARWVEDVRSLVQSLPAYVQCLIRDGEAQGDFTDPGYRHADEVFQARHVRRKGDRPPHFARSGELFNDALYRHVTGPSEFTIRGTIRDYDGLGRIGEISAPVLFVCGEHDPARPETMREFAGMVHEAEVTVIPEVAHLAFIEDEPAFLLAVRSFLEEALSIADGPAHHAHVGPGLSRRPAYLICE